MFDWRTLFGLLCVALLTLASHSPEHDHEFHVSKTKVEYVAAQAELQISMHLFIDDLELALREAGVTESLRLATDREAATADEHIAAYLRRQFGVSVNGQAVSCRYLGRETSPDLAALWIYLEASAVPAPQRIQVRQAALTELYADQKNLVNVTSARGQRAVLLLDRTRPQGQVTFD